MNFGELQTAVSYWVDDLNFTYFTKPQVKFWLNNAQKEAQRLLLQAGEDYYMITVKAPTVTNQRNYMLPDDFLQSHRVEIKTTGTFPNENKRTIYPITPQQQDLLPGKTGDPAAFYIQNGQMILCPCPGNIPYTIILNYSYLVEDMVNDSDTPDIPSAYHELVALLAAKDAFIKDARQNAELLQKIEEYKTSIKRDAENRTLDYPRMVVETDAAYYGSLY
jgi:hypothetical protein